MTRKDRAVKYGTRNKSSKTGSIRMNSTISRSNLESLLTEGWLASLIVPPEGDWEIKLDIPETIPFTVVEKKEVAH